MAPKKAIKYDSASIVNIGRSDGLLYDLDEINSKARRRVKAGDSKPGSSVGVALDEGLAFGAEGAPLRDLLIRWLVGLANATAAELGWPKDQQYILSLPANYRLHPLQSENSKRVDMYLYGHPSGCGPASVYKSPPDFFPHLIWLLSDSTNYAECGCAPCHTMMKKADRDPIDNAKGAKVAPRGEQEKHSKQAKATQKAFDLAAAAAAAKKETAREVAANPKPREQNLDSGFRTGEMVWFRSDSDAGWRLGLVASNSIDRKLQRIKPLTYPNNVELQDSLIPHPPGPRMRPFLTFNVPGIENYPELKGRYYQDIDWDGLRTHAAGRSNIEETTLNLAASKIAALQIDGSFSTYNYISGKNGQRQHYGGVFLGAERVVIGDAIRQTAEVRARNTWSMSAVTAKTPHAQGGVIRITDIYVDPPPQPDRYAEGKLTLSGEAWQLVSYPSTARIPDEIKNNQPQGPYFAKEAFFHTNLSSKLNLQWVWVKGTSETISLGRKEIAGRAYVTFEILGWTDPDKLGVLIANGLPNGDNGVTGVVLTEHGKHAEIRAVGRVKSRLALTAMALSQPAQPLLLDGVVEDV